tara:strand:- start:506 stop:1099 length:594 start_codon:yes stop_codon:yes gene_type:complete
MPAHISEQKRNDIRDALADGMKLADIRTLLNTSAGTISNIKREMGLPLRRMSNAGRSYIERLERENAKLVAKLEQRGFTPSPENITTAPEATTPAPTVMHHRDISRRSPLETVEDVQPAPAQAYTPQEYFEAIVDGLRQRDMENAVLRDEVTGLRSTEARLEADNRKLLSELNQCKLQMANWSGPAALPGRTLGNGG